MSYIGSRDFMADVSLGLVSGYSAVVVNAYDTNANTTISTVGLETGIIASYSSSADITTITSTSNSDVHQITIEGLDNSFAAVTRTVTLTGQTAATFTGLRRVNSVYNASATATVGTLYVWVPGGGSTAGVPNVASAIRSKVRLTNSISDEHSLSSIYTIPAGKSGIILSGSTIIGDSKFMQQHFWMRNFGGVFWQMHHIDVLSQDYIYSFAASPVIAEKTDLEMRCTVTSGTAHVSANYCLLLKDNA